MDIEQNSADIIPDYKETPLWKETLPMEERLEFLVKELTLEEKLQCLTIRAPEIERLGLKSFMIGGEAAHGVEARHDQGLNKGEPAFTTTFTQPIGMSATWDTELLEKVGTVTGTEARAVYKKKNNIGLSRWGPTIDMERDPRWGRTEEGYGEDPYLTGKLSSAYIQGLQGRDNFYLRCGATLKHFYANNEEEGRECSSSSLDPRNKYEYYLEPFRRAIVEGRAEAIMTSYNEINGIPAIVNMEIQELAKDKWGLKGHVVCDMGDLEQTVTKHKYFETDAQTLAYGLKAGVDCFNDREEVVIAAAREALKRGLIREEDIDRALGNTFATKLHLGMYDRGNSCPYTDIGSEWLNCKEHKDICLEVAKKAMILLKNDKELLPLKATLEERIAVVGPLANMWCKDWYSGLPLATVTSWEGLKNKFSPGVLSLADGSDRIKIRAGERYLAVRADGTLFLTSKVDAEVFEHTDWGDNRHTLRATSIQKFLMADMDTGSILASKDEVFSWFVQEVFYLQNVGRAADGSMNNILECWNHTPISVDDEDRLIFDSSKGYEESTDNEGKDITLIDNTLMNNGAIFSFEIVTNGINQAVDLAKEADKVIAVMGCHPIIHCKEGVDRINLTLPAEQRKLLQSLKRVNPNIILVLITNYPYIIDWEKENLPAILMTASGSQELGTAIAKAISGDFSPAGRLNMTWYLREEQLPPKRDYDIIQGKRTYQYWDGEVLYPFGYGLTYTKFIYENLLVTQETDHIKLKLGVKNIGFSDSDEVVQLYVKQLSSRTTRPIKQLKGFQRIYIPAGEVKEIVFLLDYEELKYYDVVTGTMILEDSDYKFVIGASSEDIRLETTIHVNGTVIPSRDMSKAISCDHYDSYDNLYLHRGHDGKPCILPKKALGSSNLPERGDAVYQDVCFRVHYKKLMLDMKAEEQGTVTVWYGEDKIGEITLEAMKDFKEIEMPIKMTDIALGERKALRIHLLGRIGVVEFRFQN